MNASPNRVAVGASGADGTAREGNNRRLAVPVGRHQLVDHLHLLGPLAVAGPQDGAPAPVVFPHRRKQRACVRAVVGGALYVPSAFFEWDSRV